MTILLFFVMLCFLHTPLIVNADYTEHIDSNFYFDKFLVSPNGGSEPLSFVFSYPYSSITTSNLSYIGYFNVFNPGISASEFLPVSYEYRDGLVLYYVLYNNQYYKATPALGDTNFVSFSIPINDIDFELGEYRCHFTVFAPQITATRYSDAPSRTSAFAHSNVAYGTYSVSIRGNGAAEIDNVIFHLSSSDDGTTVVNGSFDMEVYRKLIHDSNAYIHIFGFCDAFYGSYRNSSPFFTLGQVYYEKSSSLDPLTVITPEGTQLGESTGELESQISVYDDITNTSLQQVNVSNAITEFDDSIFSQLASTSSLMTSIITSFYSKSGIFGDIMNMFLVIVVAGLIIGIANHAVSVYNHDMDS